MNTAYYRKRVAALGDDIQHIEYKIKGSLCSKEIQLLEDQKIRLVSEQDNYQEEIEKSPS